MMTGFAEPEFTALLPHFEHALAAPLQDRTIDGHPRTSRRYSAYDNGLRVSLCLPFLA